MRTGDKFAINLNKDPINFKDFPQPPFDKLFSWSEGRQSNSYMRFVRDRENFSKDGDKGQF